MNSLKRITACFISLSVGAASFAASAAVTESVDFSDKLAVLRNLIDECNSRGIPTEYENITYNVIERFEEYINDDIVSEKPDEMTSFNISKINGLYSEAKEKLEGYLSNSGTYFCVVKPDVLNLHNDGSVLYDGETPVISVGYGHFDTAADDMENFSKFGADNIQLETGPSRVMKNTSWKFMKSNNPDASYEFITDGAQEGDYAIKFTFNGAKQDNTFISMYQTVDVTPGKKYILTGKRKVDGVMSDTWVSVNDFSNRNYVSSASDWRDFSIKYTIPEGVTSTVVRVNIESTAAGFYLDDLCFAEDGTTDNLLVNGGFEDKDAPEYAFDENSAYLAELIENLQTAKENNLAVSLLLSPHYFPDDLSEDVYFDSGAFIDFNIHDESVKKVIEDYLRGLLSVISEYKDCIQNICISNEPGFALYTFHDFYLPKFQAYLEEKHVSIEKLNEAYKTSYTDFSQIDMPDGISGDNSIWNAMAENSEVYYDLIEFNEIIFTEWHSWMAGIVREYISDKPVHSKLLETNLDSSEESYYYGRMIQGADLEMFDTFSDYAGNDALTYADDIDSYYTTMFYYDYMQSVTGKPVYNSEDHVIRDKTSEYSDLYSAHVGNYLWQGAVHGRNMSTLWLWDRNTGDNPSFEGSILYRPDVVEKVGHTSLDLTRLSTEITELWKDSPEVAIYYSKPSKYYDKEYDTNLFNAYKSTLGTGKKVGIVSDMSIDKLTGYKVLIIPGAVYGKENTKNKIEEFISTGGKVIYAGDVLSANEYKLPLDNSVIIENGFEYTSENVKEQFIKLFKKIGILDVELIDERTGKSPDGVDWQYTVTEDGELLVNVANLDYQTSKNISVYYKCRKVSGMTDLINGENIGGSVLVNGYEPRLLSYKEYKPGIKNVSYIENERRITWDTTDGRAACVTVYRVRHDGVFEIAAKTSNNSFLCDNDGCYVIKPDGDNGYSEMINVGNENAFSVEVTDVEIVNGNVSCTIRITNVSDLYASDIVTVRFGNGENDETEFNISAKSGETKELSFSMPVEMPTEINVE